MKEEATAEDRARWMLDQMEMVKYDKAEPVKHGMTDPAEMTAGEVGELANLIAEHARLAMDHASTSARLSTALDSLDALYAILKRIGGYTSTAQQHAMIDARIVLEDEGRIAVQRAEWVDRG